jgi:transcriptional regulator with XRE-family HTH domain
MKRFGEKLHKLRSYKNMTLSDLAKQLGYSTHTYISEVEAGKKIPNAMFILNVANLFDCSTDELMKDDLELRLPKS